MSKPTHQRVLIVTRNLPPLVGGMERLNWHMADELAKYAEVKIVGPEGSAATPPAGVEIVEVPLRPLWKFLISAGLAGRRLAGRWKPDVVLAGSGLTAPLARLAARRCGARTAVYAHGLDMAVQHPIYRALWLPAVRHADHLIANSSPTAALCRGIGAAAERLHIVHPGVELPAPADQVDPACTGAAFRVRHELGERPLLLSVGRLSTRKGLREFVTQALPAIATQHPDVLLLVIGDAPKQALHAEAQTPESIQSAAAAAGVGKNIRFLGVITDYRLLGAAYRAADVHVFPVREIPGDPEGFGMVAVEAAAHGLPTVAFAAGGIVDAVAEGRSGRLVANGDYPGFAKAVNQTLGQRDALRATCVDFAQSFAWPAFGRGVWAALCASAGESDVSSQTD